MTWLIRVLIRFYQIVISPPLHFIGGPGSGCRFQPSCSRYFLEAVETHGPLRGSWMGVKRICRCNPWGGTGHDPVPPKDAVTSKHCTCHNDPSGDKSPPDQDQPTCTSTRPNS